MVVAAVALSSCNDDYPSVHPKLVDWKNQRYLNHELVDKENVQFRKTTWSSNMETLHGDYCFEAREIARLNDWAREQKRSCECR